MDEFISGRPALVTTHDVLSESITLIGARLGADRAVRFARSLLASSVIEIIRPDESVEQAAVAMYEKLSDPDFSFTDCVSFSLMRAIGISKAFTFDEDFQKAGFECIPAGGIRRFRKPRNRNA